jgi:hypothetical protein
MYNLHFTLFAPDIWTSDEGMYLYTVIPSDCSNTADVDILLKSRYGTSKFTSNRDGSGILSWTLTSSYNNLASAIESIEDVQSVIHSIREP